MKVNHCKKIHHHSGQCKNGFEAILSEYKNGGFCAKAKTKSNCDTYLAFRDKKFHLRDSSYGQYLKVEQNPMYLTLGNALYERFVKKPGDSGRVFLQNHEVTRFTGCNNFKINNTDTICIATYSLKPNFHLFYDRVQKNFLFRDISQSWTDSHVTRNRDICFIQVLLKNNEEVAIIKCGSGYLRTRGLNQIELNEDRKTYYHIENIIGINDFTQGYSGSFLANEATAGPTAPPGTWEFEHPTYV